MPSITRRKTLATLAAAPLALGSAIDAQASTPGGWPSRQPIRFVVPYPPGGASDVTARLLATRLTETLGQSVVVENRPGANGILALESVAKSAPDGYTLLMANLGPNAINAAVYRKLPYDPIKDFTPITLTSIVPLVVLVGPSFPARSMQELIALAKSQPGKLSFASAGNGASNHLAGELLKSMTGIEMTHVPYKGDAPGMPDVIAGTVSMMFPTVIAGMPNIRSGKMRALAVTSAKRTPSLPDVPTVAESGVSGFEAVSWGGVMGPGGLPPDIVQRLNAEINKILKEPDTSQKLIAQGADLVGTTPEAFATYLKNEIDKYTRIARDKGIVLE